jgi:6-phosphogluconolactonase (cycloisomerase 2 family)
LREEDPRLLKYDRHRTYLYTGTNMSEDIDVAMFRITQKSHINKYFLDHAPDIASKLFRVTNMLY